MAGIAEDFIAFLLHPENLERLRNNKGLVKQLTKMKALPSSIRLYLRNLAGVTDKITEDFFSKSELKEIKRRVSIAEAEGSMGNQRTSGFEQYRPDLDFSKIGLIGYDFSESFSLKGVLTDPKVNIDMTLGQAVFTKDKKGNIIVKDKHDFHGEGSVGVGYDDTDMSNLEAEYKKGFPARKTEFRPDPYSAETGRFTEEEKENPFLIALKGRSGSHVDETDEEMKIRANKALKDGDITLAGYARIIAQLDQQDEGIPIELNIGKITQEDKYKAHPSFAHYIAQDTKSGYGKEYEDVGIPSKIREDARKYLAAGGNVPSTDIKDYYRRSWGIGDRQPQKRLKAFAPLVAPYLLPYAAAFIGTTATGLMAQQKIQNYFENNPDAMPKFKEWISAYIPGIHGPKDKETEELEKAGQIETFPKEDWSESFGIGEGTKIPEEEKIKPPVNIPVELPKSEGFPIPEQKGWQEFILYNKAIEKKIKDNAPADKEKASDEYLDAVREGIELHDGNIVKAMKIFGLNREYIRAKFSQRGQKLEGTGGQIIETIKPIENIELFTEYTNNLKKDSSLIDTIYNEGIKTKRLNKEDKYLNIQDIANAIGMDISTKGSKNQLLKLLEEDVRKTDEARSVAKKYHINDVIKKAKEWSSQKLMEGDEPSSSKRYKHVQKSDASLFTENNKVIRRIRELTQLDKTYLEDQIEDIGHPESVRTSEKYKDLLKNINTIQDYVFQDKDINRDVIQTQGHAGDMESIYKKLNKLLNKTNVNKELIKIQKEIDARLKKTKKQIRDHKEYTIGKNQDKRIARIEITLPQEGEAFTANNLGVDLSNVDKKWIMGKVDLINPEAKKFDDLNDNQKEIYRANLNDQYLEMIGKIYKEAGYGKGEILDIQETISEGTHSKKGVLEKARGGPILSGVDQYILDRYK